MKERLVGAAVLMAAAIILIPEMLSGPDRNESEPAARRSAEEPSVKTYTIDLNRPPGTPQDHSTAVSEAAPPPEAEGRLAEDDPPAAPSARTDQANPEPPVETAPTRPSVSEPQPSAIPPVQRAEAPKPPPAAAPTREPEARAPASTAAVPTTKGWAVQLGSFSSRASAERLAAEVRADRHEAFVMPVQSGGSTLYRVRIGPMRERAAADETLKRVKGKFAGAAVVTHP